METKIVQGIVMVASGGSEGAGFKVWKTSSGFAGRLSRSIARPSSGRIEEGSINLNSGMGHHEIHETHEKCGQNLPFLY